MTYNNIKLKELPKDIKFATFNSDNEDIILGEYIIATLIYNGFSLDQLLEPANEIEDLKEREDVKMIVTNIVLDFINLNPEFAEILEQNDRANEFIHFFLI